VDLENFSAAQLFNDGPHLPGGHPVDDHLDHGQQERLLAPLVPRKKFRGEVPAPQPACLPAGRGNHKSKFSYAGLERFIPVSVAVPLPLFGAS